MLGVNTPNIVVGKTEPPKGEGVSLMKVAQILLAKPEIDKEVEEFAKKMLDYTDRDGEKARRMGQILEVVMTEVVPIRKELGEEGFKQVIDEARNKIVSELGGVTGFLDEKRLIEDNLNRK